MLALNSDFAAPASGQLLSLASLVDSGSLSTTIQGSWRCVRILKGHEGKVYAIAFSPDGQTLVSASENHTIKIWNVYSGTQPQRLSGHSSWINRTAFSPDGKLLATCSSDKTIGLWRCD